MAQLKFTTSKPMETKKNRRSYVAPACRRCGTECMCSEDEIDAGGPA